MVIDIDNIDFNISIDECFNNLKPHPKFSHCTFENYIPDENYPSQYYIKETLTKKINALSIKKEDKKVKKGFFGFLKSTSNESQKNIQNLYIDGGYGVGKTHLLSASYNTFNGKKAFLSFSELCYFFNYIGLERTAEEFSKLDLLLIDEFELDDPATTRMMAKFFLIINKNTLIITTSNTLPSELGKMKFQVDEFVKEIGIIANSFKTVVVEGLDYRKKNKVINQRNSGKFFLDSFKNYTPEKRSKLIVKYDKLIKVLTENHPFKYFVIPAKCEAIFIEDFQPFLQLNNALRFTHLVDHCYYYNTKLFIKSTVSIDNFFTKEMIESCFSKKFYRCLSRLDELGIFFKN